MSESLDNLLRSTFDDISQLDALSRAFPGAVSPEFRNYVEALLVSQERETEARTSKGAVEEVVGKPTRKDFEAFTRLVKSKSVRSSEAAAAELFLDLLEPSFGTIWTTKLGGSMAGKDWGVNKVPPNVAIVGRLQSGKKVPPVIAVAPTSDWTEFASDQDLVLPEGPDHSEMMLEVWNALSMPSALLYKCVGFLTKEEEHWLTVMQRLLEAKLPTLDVPASHRGDPISPDDVPRVIFREFEQLRALLLQSPAERPKARSPAVGRAPVAKQTPKKAYSRPILKALVAMGGRGTPNDVLRNVEESLRGVLTKADHGSLPSDPRLVRWHRSVHWARLSLVKAGYMQAGAPVGHWAITEKGRKALETGEIDDLKQP